MCGGPAAPEASETTPKPGHPGSVAGPKSQLIGDDRGVADLVHLDDEPVLEAEEEHGIDIEKKRWLGQTRSAAEIDMMRSLKALLDPKNLLNPGKVVD